MAARLRLLPGADSDIADALTFTRRTFGDAKYIDYASLIEEALDAVVADPWVGELRRDIDAEARIYRIAKPGRRARHVLLYRVLEQGELVEVVGLPYDGMDLPQRWPRR